MPLEKARARSYIEGARNAYRTGPRAEYIQNGANFLEEALNQIEQDSLTASRALNDAARLQRELDEEKTAYRKLREQSAHADACVAVLRAIASSPKGAALKAAAQLKAMGAEEAPQPVVAIPNKVIVP